MESYLEKTTHCSSLACSSFQFWEQYLLAFFLVSLVCCMAGNSSQTFHNSCSTHSMSMTYYRSAFEHLHKVMAVTCFTSFLYALVMCLSLSIPNRLETHSGTLPPPWQLPNIQASISQNQGEEYLTSSPWIFEQICQITRAFSKTYGRNVLSTCQVIPKVGSAAIFKWLSIFVTIRMKCNICTGNVWHEMRLAGTSQISTIFLTKELVSSFKINMLASNAPS